MSEAINGIKDVQRETEHYGKIGSQDLSGDGEFELELDFMDRKNLEDRGRDLGWRA